MLKMILILSMLSSFVFANSCVYYEQELKKCNSLKNSHEKKMCRLGLFAKCKKDKK
ncbi:hypothetical protein KJQ62_00440 [Campylobacter coli]|uniref:Periplasmic protein n=1 Tax=Campylobacter jejuni TaxID=197 RepID=A0A6C7UL34_CAMJU|nr:hypothetical protein [Campylobacter coli]